MTWRKGIDEMSWRGEDKVIAIVVLLCNQWGLVTYFAIIHSIRNPPSNIEVCGPDLTKNKVQMSAWDAMPLMKEA